MQGETYTRRIENLKEKVKIMLLKEENPLAQLKQVDTLQRLGLSYHFRGEIKRILNVIFCNNSHCFNDPLKKNLHDDNMDTRYLQNIVYTKSIKI